MMLLTSSMLAVLSLSPLGCATTGDGRADDGLRRAAQREARLTAMRRQALAGAMNQQQWDELMDKLRQTHASLDAVGKAGNVLFDALSVKPAPPRQPPPADATRLVRVKRRLAEVRRALMGKRRSMTPESLHLRRLEFELVREQAALSE